MEISDFRRRLVLKDVLSFIIFVACVAAGTLFINAFIFRSFSVVGPSMEKTLYTGDRLIVNRLPVTLAQLQNKTYVPERGQIIVFKNPNYHIGLNEDEYIVKRVIAFAGERVTIEDGHFMVYNGKYPAGFDPDEYNNNEPGSPTDGDNLNTIVPDGEIFVAGDHRQKGYSFDSRNGLGTVPLYDIVGPVSTRIFPFDKIRTFK